MHQAAFEPCIPTKAAKVPDRPEWIHEVKHDGYRLIVQRKGKRVRLFTRNGHDWSDRFPLISEAALRPQAYFSEQTYNSRRARRAAWPEKKGPTSLGLGSVGGTSKQLADDGW